MIFNYLKIALRYLLRNRSFSVINIFGLTLGFLCFMLIALYVHDELSFDMFHSDSERVYRVIQHERKEDGSIRDVAPVSARLGPEAGMQLPGVEADIRISSLGRLTMGNDPASRGYVRIITIDPNFFSFFNFPLAEGDPATALKEPDGVVLSKQLAEKYFGKEPAVGKRLWTSLRRNRQPVELVVTGVLQEFPKNSHLQFDAIFTDTTWPTVFSWYSDFMSRDWSSNSFVTYLKLRVDADPRAIETSLEELAKANYPKDKQIKSTFTLQPLKEIHLYSDNIQGNEINSNGMKPFYLYLFGVVAFLILLIACINYMNLTTAAAYKRTREIGTRKTLGAMHRQLIFQFMGEAVLMSVVSLLLATVMIQAVLPSVNAFAGKEMSLEKLPIGWILTLIATVTTAGLLSSLYPAFIIARVRPTDALKKDIRFGTRSLPVRKLLVAGQFAVSIMMIASTLVIYDQLNYMRTKDLGFEVTNKLVIDINGDRLRRNFENVKAEFSNVAEVQNITTSTRVPGEWKSFPIADVKREGEGQSHEMIYVGIDQDFLRTYDIQLLEGRNFTAGSSDSLKVILTRLAADQMGLVNPLGQVIAIPSVRFGGNREQLDKPFLAEVIGIAEDFHFESFRHKMMPVIFGSPNTQIQRIDYYTLDVQTKNWGETIEKLKAVNNRIDAENPLEYTFLDGRFEEFYQADEKRGLIFLVFSLMIVLIACLGLFALVSYSIESRTKEIGIRKVLGATVTNIVAMVSREFGVLVALGGLLAIPASWYMMNQWLDDFEYRVSLRPSVFALAAVLALVIALTTIGFRAVRAAIANPVDSLHTE